jgi:hypothetical protein
MVTLGSTYRIWHGHSWRHLHWRRHHVSCDGKSHETGRAYHLYTEQYEFRQHETIHAWRSDYGHMVQRVVIRLLETGLHGIC